MNKTLAIKLKESRKARRKTQNEMAELLNVRRSTYGEYERGVIMPPMDKLQILANYFEVSVDYLIGNTDVPTHGENGNFDVTDALNEILNNIERGNAFENITDEETMELLKASIENSLKMAKLIEKGRK